MMNEADFYASLPKKRMGAGALFLDQENKLLLVKPTYREYWLLPGGAIEEDESPFQGCAREVREELGLPLAPGSLLCLDYVSGRGILSEGLQFVFAGGRLTQELIKSIKLPQDELSAFCFVPLSEAVTMVSIRMGKRLPYCFQAFQEQTTIYLEEGVPVSAKKYD